MDVSNIMSLTVLKPAAHNCSRSLQVRPSRRRSWVGLMNKFMENTKNGVHIHEGWPDIRAMAYTVSKMGITVLFKIHAGRLSEQRTGSKGPTATTTTIEGAETHVYLPLLPSDAEGPHGEFVMEKKGSALHAPYPATSSYTHVALVTGANKGIGFPITRNLCRHMGALTCWSTTQASSSDLNSDSTPVHIQAEVTMKTNFFGTRDVCTELLPLIQPQVILKYPSHTKDRNLPCPSTHHGASPIDQYQYHLNPYTPSHLISPLFPTIALLLVFDDDSLESEEEMLGQNH
ncbi:hypothetical protein HPG69_016148 [Diceros bicornis minor]|uniref:Uncharacterized protein n=1 Tax=Diceros bicornis minor TaxID=77932 RepID=A0A7J7FHJ4_DICBM|nr:hypothetical protein HPG69_016148 [Diceros bicornis minor]